MIMKFNFTNKELEVLKPIASQINKHQKIIEELQKVFNEFLAGKVFKRLGLTSKIGKFQYRFNLLENSIEIIEEKEKGGIIYGLRN